jgi:hypothetical protein
MSVKRYEFQSEYGYGEIIPDVSDGTFVKYEDYARLEQRIAELEQKIAKLTTERDKWGTRLDEEQLTTTRLAGENFNLKVEIAALQEQVARMPVCVGYVSDAGAIVLRHVLGRADGLEVVAYPQNQSLAQHPIYIDPPEEKGE